ncbi:hypothetical protein [Exiguobacterium flavidum]|uniref:hypothetical protein n=1 Tax=Exiguobacterium flavidum TaxID=2184695 RepID=UPI000DF7966E|nr:hypothetical protein [Exiguobacterium flavidum]
MPDSRHSHIVTTLIFNEEEQARNAFALIDDLQKIKEVDLEQMALVHREEDGEFSFKDAVDFSGQDQSFKGSLIGMAVGVVGGPFGMLVGSVAGYLIGANRDERQERESFDLFNRTLNQVDGTKYGVILISETDEDHKAIDAIALELGGTIRRSGEQLVDTSTD